MDNKSKASSKSRRENGEELSLKGVSLFKLDVNYDHLKQFLEGIQSDVDHHTEDIDYLKKLVGPNDIIQMLIEQYHLIADSLQFSDKDMEKETSGALQNYLTQIQGKQLRGGPIEKTVIDLRGKLFSVINVLQSLYREKKRQDQRITKLEQDMLTKFDTKDCKEKMRKQKNALETQIEELQRTNRNDIDIVEKKLNQDIAKFQESVREVERKTLWKIQDCQDLLTKRINEEFVIEAVRSLEDKLMKEIAQTQSGEQNLKFQQDISYLRSLIKGLDDQIGDKQLKLKQQLNDLQDQMRAKFSNFDKMTEQTRLQGDKIADINSRLASAISRLDVQHQIDAQRQKVKQLEDQINQLNEENRQRVEALKDMNLNADNVAYLLSKIDPHKICSLEADVKKLEEQSIRNNVHWETLDQEFKTRFDSFTFFQQLYQNQNTQQKEKDYITRDELNRILLESQNKGQLEEDKFKKLQKDLVDMSAKVENANEIERRMTRIFRDLDINNLVKQVKLKAGEEEMRKELMILENKIAQAQETLSLLRREIDQLQVQMKKSPSGVQTSISPATDQVIGINTKKLYPINCLSCQINPSGQQRVKGNDGKYYQADFKRYDNFQEYVLEDQSQLTYQQQAIQRPQSAVVNKSINAQKRPVSAKK
ncbi:hypothetical protein pb186bvf_016975 [Paramecium bursaria]